MAYQEGDLVMVTQGPGAYRRWRIVSHNPDRATYVIVEIPGDPIASGRYVTNVPEQALMPYGPVPVQLKLDAWMYRAFLDTIGPGKTVEDFLAGYLERHYRDIQTEMYNSQLRAFRPVPDGTPGAITPFDSTRKQR